MYCRDHENVVRGVRLLEPSMIVVDMTVLLEVVKLLGSHGSKFRGEGLGMPCAFLLRPIM